MAISRRMKWTGRVISVLASLMFVFSASIKVVGGPDIEKGMAHLGLPLSMVRPLTFLEIACVTVYLVPPTAVLGAVLLTGYLGGAMLAHWRVGDPVWFHIVLGGLIWLGLYLREPRLRPLLPIRRGGAPVDPAAARSSST